MPKKLPRMIAELPLRPVRLLHRTGYIGKSVVRVRSDQSYRAHNQNQDHGQHYRVLSNILPRVFRPNPADEFGHALPPAPNLLPTTVDYAIWTHPSCPTVRSLSILEKVKIQVAN